MPNRRSLLTLAVAALVAIALGSVVGIRVADDSSPSPAADGSAAHDAPTGSAPGRTETRSGTKQDGGDEDAEEDGEADDVRNEVPDPSASAAPDAPGPDSSGPSPTTDGVVVVPEAAGASGVALPGLTSGSEKKPPTAYDPPSAASSARGRLVADYPARLLPVAPRSVVVTSSVAPTSRSAQVALVARRSTSPVSVLRFYRSALGGAGFREVRVPAVGGADGVAFRRGGDRVVVTIDPGPARTYSVYATLVAGEA
jgi:hypothetical protein